ncbi:mkiaa0324 protein-like protein [Leptomonas pyrrhocoris]|uniref:Mkiaa0324 protein-like protein n=1 Tax=Leptomonas pyrrhocoris TaxID=157538 RepID=A0A0M9G3N3_LEPPY|nr:mkiaa0324 protein-like protein [Leptomonas pyrrhocoris]XP_015660145.1 mkiaa0324 protein-like protein [Leptomonas pyrrhocoris]XP_015660146.1 mkiaa0324 protein-like protein [Leptomonas pyrrhocoris]KPA81705.1 mkiaa0324 protein-like protein [Leptomonas pyrrhocoris]KPA81706.1 mkiaa0324 protein-like protein [Leptomonas pyrrhocoris]KPA81707.1 mkiaa0324 protein-like protein [Leptomonas pyrrhocoris]|eukprot:XP_015660144.1 mkiaa0324 protein-like protein [Leptomonas pyrrhocoris]
MFSRTVTALARSRPPFAVFYKSMSGVLTKMAPVQRMKVASTLWRRTAPRYGIRYSAPRVAAAKEIYKKEGRRLAPGVKAAATKPARRSRKSKAARRSRKASATSKKNKNTKRSSKRVKASRATATRAKPAKKAVTPYASFTANVLKQTKLAPTATNKSRVFRMWLLTGQQRSSSLTKRISMAVRLLNKDQRSRRKLSKKLTRKAGKKTTKRSSKARKTAAKKSRKLRRSVTKKTNKTKKSPKAAAKQSKARKARLASRKKAMTRRRVRKAAAAKSKTRKSAARKAAAAAKTKSRKSAMRKSKAKAARKPRKAAARPRGRRVAAKKMKHIARKTPRRSNPYIEFYRRVCMTGLLPNGPKVVGSRTIKALWARTHKLPTMDARVAQATRLLEAQTGASAKTVVSPVRALVPRKNAAASHTHAPATVVLKEIKVPHYYEKNPFGATYAALLPMLQTIPSSTRMAHVAKAWTSTALKNDHRSAKQRIAAVAQQLKA